MARAAHTSLTVLTSLMAAAQIPQTPPVQFVCPMDPDVRSSKPGRCPRCGMALEAGIQEPLAYRLRMSAVPANLPAGKPVELRFELLDPRTNLRALKFEVVHEKLFHLFLVSADLNYFVHDHPSLGSAGVFSYRTTLPKPGIYRVLADCYPKGGTPQLLPAFITTAGYSGSIAESGRSHAADLSEKQASNLSVALRMEPEEPIAGKKTMLFFRVTPGEKLEPYLAAWGHLLAASEDLVDAIHEHPMYEPAIRSNSEKEIQFNMFFPRGGMYRVWVQFQRAGVVNTASFTIPVRSLE